ncbi:MAG: precorrin-3B synthase [Reyranella sp.]|nr:precorrin-3B synthase [Alphaproteobacteria bacterium]MBR2817094.1 precorrin-3B synthase [Reyranella sp.]
MQSGDGLIARVRPRVGMLSLDQARALAGLAERLGNGHIDLTRRANLQIRGLLDEDLAKLQAELDRLGLIDADAEVEAIRNIMVAPLSAMGSTVRRIAADLERALMGDRRLVKLPTKFGLLVDEGGPASLANERADICLRVVEGQVAVGLDSRDGTYWLGACPPSTAIEIVVRALHTFLDSDPHRRLRDLPIEDQHKIHSALLPSLSALPPFEKTDGRALGMVQGAVGIAAPFGRLEAACLGRLTDLAADAGATELRLSPWRTLYVAVRDEAAGRSLLESAQALGLIIQADDPMLRIEACPGAPDCESSSVDTRGDARRLASLVAARGFAGSIHVSGCAKGCAKSAPSDLLLVGSAGRYSLTRGGETRGTVEARDLAAALAETSHG